MTQQTADSTRKVTITCQSCLTPNRVDTDRIDEGPRCGQCASPILLDRPVSVSDEDFARVVHGAEIPVLVGFYADWCTPCRAMAPVLDELAEVRAGELLVAQLDTDRNPETAQQYDIRSVPTLIVFQNGQESARQTGAAPRDVLERMVFGDR